MFGNRFYNQTTRRYVAIFGTLFNDIKVGRSKDNLTVDFLMDVPVNYGPMQKFLARLEQDPDLDAPAMTLPRMTFEITNLTYDGTRKLTNAIRNSVIDVNKNVLKTQYTPAPYNLDFQLNIMTKYAEDGTKILEQILPFFKPEQTLSVKLIDDLNVYFDVPIVLNSVSTEDTYEGDFQTRRALIWTLNFTLKGYYFGPLVEKKVVKFIRSNIFDDTLDKIDTTPIQLTETSDVIVEDDTYVGVNRRVWFNDFANGSVYGISNIDSFDSVRNANNQPFTLEEELPDLVVRYGDTLYITNESDTYSLVILNSIIDNQTGAFGFDVDNVVGDDEATGMPAISGGTIAFTPNTAKEYYYISPEKPEFAGVITIQGAQDANNTASSTTTTNIPDANTDIRDYINNGDLPSSIVQVTPGMDAAGNPTKDPTKTIPFSDIDYDDDWDYIVQITDGDDYDPS